MEKLKIQSQFGYRRPRKYEAGGGESKTEQRGYIKPKVQIQNMIAAGERLDAYKKEMYDFRAGDVLSEDFHMSATRKKGADLTDVMTEQAKLVVKAKEARKADLARRKASYKEKLLREAKAEEMVGKGSQVAENGESAVVETPVEA